MHSESVQPPPFFAKPVHAGRAQGSVSRFTGDPMPQNPWYRAGAKEDVKPPKKRK